MSVLDRQEFGEPKTLKEEIRWILSETDNPLVAAAVLAASAGIIYTGYKILQAIFSGK